MPNLPNIIQCGVYFLTDDGTHHSMALVHLDKDTIAGVEMLFEKMKETAGTDLAARLEILEFKTSFVSSVVLQQTFAALSHKVETEKLAVFKVPLNS